MIVYSGSDLLMPVTERRSLNQGLINRLNALIFFTKYQYSTWCFKCVQSRSLFNSGDCRVVTSEALRIGDLKKSWRRTRRS